MAEVPGMRKRLLLPILRKFVVTFIVLAFLAGCANTTKVDVALDTTAGIRARPNVVYVMDFDLDADKIKLDPRRLRDQRHPGLVFVNEVKHSLGLYKTPQEEAKDLTDLTANSVVEGLAKAGVEAHRIPSGAALPREGWLVRGTFRQVDEGNRMRRALGAGGQTDIQVAVVVDDLSANPGRAPLLQLDTDTDAKSNKLSGSGGHAHMKLTSAMGRMSVYSLALKYVLAGYDLDRNAKETGARIAEEVAKRVRGIEPSR
jgi:hypothetical protein